MDLTPGLTAQSCMDVDGMMGFPTATPRAAEDPSLPHDWLIFGNEIMKGMTVSVPFLTADANSNTERKGFFDFLQNWFTVLFSAMNISV